MVISGSGGVVFLEYEGFPHKIPQVSDKASIQPWIVLAVEYLLVVIGEKYELPGKEDIEA